MRLSPILSTLFLAFHPICARAHDGAEDRDNSSTITSSATLACATGDTRSKYESCSSFLSSKSEECNENDLQCACSLANSGFKIPSNMPFFNSPNGPQSQANSITAPSQTGAVNGRFRERRGQETDGVRVFLGVGICVAITVGGFAAFS